MMQQWRRAGGLYAIFCGRNPTTSRTLAFQCGAPGRVTRAALRPSPRMQAGRFGAAAYALHYWRYGGRASSTSASDLVMNRGSRRLLPAVCARRSSVSSAACWSPTSLVIGVVLGIDRVLAEAF